MAKLWQFDMRAMLAVVAAIAVPIWMIARGDASVRFWGVVVLSPVVGGCLGFLAAKWAGIWPGIFLGLFVAIVLAPLILTLWG
jgi:hypothetical protein